MGIYNIDILAVGGGGGGGGGYYGGGGGGGAQAIKEHCSMSSDKFLCINIGEGGCGANNSELGCDGCYTYIIYGNCTPYLYVSGGRGGFPGYGGRGPYITDNPGGYITYNCCCGNGGGGGLSYGPEGYGKYGLNGIGGNGGCGIDGYGGGGGGGGGRYGTGGCGNDGGGDGGAYNLSGCNATGCGGGGGGAGMYSYTGGNGGNGLVEICYPISGSYGFCCATGGNCCYTCNGYCVHRFTSDGVFCVFC